MSGRARRTREYLDARLAPLATREDLQHLRSELGLETQRVRSDLGQEMTSLRKEMQDWKVDIIKWNVASILATAALVWGIVVQVGG